MHCFKIGYNIRKHKFLKKLFVEIIDQLARHQPRCEMWVIHCFAAAVVAAAAVDESGN
jgi:glutamate racemase